MFGALRDIQPGERRVAVGAFLSLFGIIAGHTVLETARDALFLARLPPSQLPWVYLAMAVIAVLISEAPAGGAKRRVRGFRLSALLVGAALVTFGFWIFGSWKNPWALRALYVWTGLVGNVVVLELWLVLGETFTITQAKRVYRVVGAGSVLGAVAGAAVARVVSVRMVADDMLLAAAVVMILTGMGPALWLRRPERARGAGGGGQRVPFSLAQIREQLSKQPYVTRLAGLTLVSTIALTLGDYIFKSAVARTVQPQDLGSFFAGLNMVLNLMALVTQLFLMRFLLRTLGLQGSMYVLPGMLALGAGAVAFGGGIQAALFLKGADGALRQSVHRTCNELLFVPIPDSLRARFKPLIDVLGQRAGQAIASVFILSELTLNRGDTRLAAATGVLCLVWIVWAVELKPHYVELFRATLREGTLHPSADLPELDLGSLEVLFAALNSQHDDEVVGALDLLADEGRVRLIPALILYHPSPVVALKALDLLAASGRTDFVPIADRLLGHADPPLRAAALRARTAVAPDEALLREAARDESPLVKATAAVGLVAGGWSADAASVLDEILATHDPAAWQALALAIAARPAPAFTATLLQLAGSPLSEVQTAVAEAMGKLKDPEFLPALLPMLLSHEARPGVRRAFLGYGSEGVRFLEESLADTALPLEIRRHVPRSISRFPGIDAIPVLEGRLVAETNGLVRYQILRGLGRAASDNPDVPISRKIIDEALQRTLEACFRLADWQGVLSQGALEDPRRRTDGHELLAALLRDKQANSVERTFRMLSLRLRGEDVQSIYRGLRSSKPKVRAGSRELLENVTQPPLRGALLALVDDTPGANPLAGAGAYYQARPVGYEELLGILLESSGETLRCLAAYHVGELGLRTMETRLQALKQRETGFFVQRVVERALRLLSGPPLPELAPAR